MHSLPGGAPDAVGDSMYDGTRLSESATVTGLPLVSEGDAFDFLPRLPPSTVDCVITSPPYWGLRTYGHDHNHDILDAWRAREPSTEAHAAPDYQWYRENGGVLGLEPFPEWYIAHLVEILSLVREPMKPGGNLWVNIGDTYFARWSSMREDGRQGFGDSTRSRRKTPTGGYLHDKQLLLLPARFAIAMQEAGWILRNDVIWSKPATPPRPERDRLRLTHEHFFHFVKRARKGRPKYYYDVNEAEAGARDVIAVPQHRGRSGHSATFPEDLIAPRIRSSCPPGGMVVDPFCGTGRSLEVAELSGRNAYGIELSPVFAEAAREHVRSARAERQSELRMSAVKRD